MGLTAAVTAWCVDLADTGAAAAFLRVRFAGAAGGAGDVTGEVRAVFV